MEAAPTESRNYQLSPFGPADERAHQRAAYYPLIRVHLNNSGGNSSGLCDHPEGAG